MSSPLPTSGAARRAAVDACPGALRLHEAADGPLARVRIPGGRITGAQLAALSELAAASGDGHVELTSRANLQLRALRGASPVQLAAQLHAVGLLPSESHELVRNIAASPLPADAGAVAELDAALCADPALAALPGRFLFAIDSGAGDVAFSADVAVLPVGPAARFAVLFAGRDGGLRVGSDQVVPALLAAAHAFLALAQEDAAAGARRAWRLRELTDGPVRAARRVATELGVPLGAGDPALVRPTVREPVGIVEQPGGRVAVGALVPLGRLDAVQMKALESAVDLVVTPWRGVVVPGLPPDAAQAWVSRLAAAGLEVAAGSRWVGVTACAGRPGCAKALADVRRDADAATTAGAGLPVHWVGCARGCGSPAGPHVRVEATGSDYAVTAPHGSGTAPAAHVSALVADLRKG
ncbi:precorrin-3B synthase [Actinoplanes sp. N902-109]|uniref:precorrin-3B synthase n=1 Tax=Actinoplanes sp. (strain N902-109) TaxID=649831 RepID=UPI0026F3DCDD|nr:precorrin-3B synthase [Actinoplanes sp. N902-109]